MNNIVYVLTSPLVRLMNISPDEDGRRPNFRNEVMERKSFIEHLSGYGIDGAITTASLQLRADLLKLMGYSMAMNAGIYLVFTVVTTVLCGTDSASDNLRLFNILSIPFSFFLSLGVVLAVRAYMAMRQLTSYKAMSASERSNFSIKKAWCPGNIDLMYALPLMTYLFWHSFIG